MDIPISERQGDAIELQREIAARHLAQRSTRTSSRMHGHAVDLLVKIAASDARFAADARAVLEEWRNGLATPEQMRRVVTNDELEVGGGAVVSEADDGYWITTWTWVGDG